jgi:hypothetical protein
MSYHLIYANKALRQLDRLPPEFVEAVEAQLLRLAGSPVTLSIPIASPPFPPRGQLYHFTLTDWHGGLWFFTVIFLYSQDESALRVLSVTWRELIDE